MRCQDMQYGVNLFKSASEVTVRPAFTRKLNSVFFGVVNVPLLSTYADERNRRRCGD